MKKYISYGTAVFGILLLGAGILLLNMLAAPQGSLKVLPYLLVGVGCGLFGHGAGAVLQQRMIKKHPDMRKQMEIQTKDERNMAITFRSKAKAYDLMVFVYGALLPVLAVMGTDVPLVLLLVFAYLVVVGSRIYFRFQYESQM